MTPIELAIMVSRVEAICQEMGVVLRRAAFSPNIKDRLDFSCALFDARGELFAQAAHIPVHLGSMAYAMSGITRELDWQPGDLLVLNDPFLGGTHLPDVTVVSPVFHEDRLLGFVANRAHHANIGARSPGSMPISTSLDEEGAVIPPTFLRRGGRPVPEALARVVAIGALEGTGTGAPFGDFSAQMSANRVGVERLSQLISESGTGAFEEGVREINEYGERVARTCLEELPRGEYRFTDVMDDDGCGHRDLPLTVTLGIDERRVRVDFTGTTPQVEGNINCPLSVAAAAVYYVFRCLLPPTTPACAGTFRVIELVAPPGCLVNARRPAAVAAGNVETSQRVVDVVLGALAQALPGRIPAASQGTMNNVAMGSRGARPWDYYETIGGGMGGHALGAGLSAVQSHMTNTLNTPVESVEMHYPLRILRYAVRTGSGGAGTHRGGNGLVREFEFLEHAEITLLTERRTHAPWGMGEHAGAAGVPGSNRFNGAEVPGKCRIEAEPGDRLIIETPGGGGWSART